MDVQQQVVRIIDEVLSLHGRGLKFNRQTHLLGAIPEFDSMAVVALIASLEDQLGISVDDDEVDGSTFRTVGALVDLVAGKLGTVFERLTTAQDLAFDRRALLSTESPSLQFLAMPGGRGSRMLICYPPRAPARGTVVYVHPFAEEMNKSRRMAALQARALSQAGWWVVQVDLFGCGDSSGEFGDASWQDWVDDVKEVSRWAAEHCAGPVVLWGLRCGCLVAVAAARDLDTVSGLLFWQPSSSGKSVVQQFLRLELAAQMQSDGNKAVIEEMRARLGRGESVTVAGYTLHPALVSGLDLASLEPPQRPLRVTWLEVGGSADAVLTPASERAVERWRQAGHHVTAAAVRGPAFWNSVEIEEAPELIARTSASFQEALVC